MFPYIFLFVILQMGKEGRREKERRKKGGEERGTELHAFLIPVII